MSDSPSSTWSDNPDSTDVHAILVPGYWLGGWAWQEVAPTLRKAGIETHALTLPGLDGSNTAGLTLEDHVTAVLDVVAACDGDVVPVGHSGGAAVVQLAVDRDPRRIKRVVYVDSGPLKNGATLRPNADHDVALPSWEQLAAENSSIDGMDDEALATFRRRAVPHPVGVATSPVSVTDDRRLDVPTSVICTSLPAQLLQQLIEDGQIPSELLRVTNVRYIDLPTGHWPMFSRPADLANLLREEILSP